jgi:two-component system, chemotaxis family, chemotaxis protein CheY
MGGNMKTLIVEDDFTSRLLMQSVLSRYGECHIAVNGKEAVDACRTSRMKGSPYDLICMDILMPEMNGQEAVKQVREQEASLGISSSAGVKIFMVTALTSMTEVVKSFNELCDAYLFKPLDIAKLLQELKTFHLVE